MWFLVGGDTLGLLPEESGIIRGVVLCRGDWVGLLPVIQTGNGL